VESTEREAEKIVSPVQNNLEGFGFRDFGVFNQARLARQAWRLITNPESPCALVLKALAALGVFTYMHMNTHDFDKTTKI
jgi:hypothetical protein